MLGRASLLRCPRCGARGLIRGWFKLQERCPSCALPLERNEDRDYWLGGYTLNLVAAELLLALMMVVVVVSRWPDVPWPFLQYGGVVLVILVPILLFPFSRIVWLAIDLSLRPQQ